jgi:hypothetical protein
MRFWDKILFRCAKYTRRGGSRPRLIVFEHCRPIGLFGTLTTCLRLSCKCHSYGIKPFFLLSGQHYVDEQRGPNWLEYYFVQQKITEADREAAYSLLRDAEPEVQSDVRIFRSCAFPEFPSSARLNNEFFDLNLEDVSRLFFEYFAFTQPIKDVTAKFIATRFSDQRVLGIHYRGSDKAFDEADAVPYEQMLNIIEQYGKDYSRLFLATDDHAFAQLCSSKFGNKVIEYSCPPFSNQEPTPLHAPHLISTTSNYQKGFEAVVDAILLSKCSLLIKTSSTFSTWSKIFTPTLPLVLVGQPYRNPWPGGVPLVGYGYWPESIFHGRSDEFRTTNLSREKYPSKATPTPRRT